MGQPDKVDRQLEENMGLVYWVLQKYYPTFLGDDDIVQEARIGLWKACVTFNESKGNFSSYAVTCILNNIRMYFRKHERQTRNIVVSLDDFTDEEKTTTVGGLIEDPIARVEDSGIFVKDFISKLSEKEQRIIWLQFASVRQVDACKVLKCTQAHYSRLLSRIRKKWDDYNKERRRLW